MLVKSGSQNFLKNGKVTWYQKVFLLWLKFLKKCQITSLSTIHPKKTCSGPWFGIFCRDLSRTWTTFWDYITLIGMREALLSPCPFWIDFFFSLIFIKTFQIFSKVKNWNQLGWFDTLLGSLNLMKNAPRWR